MPRSLVIQLRKSPVSKPPVRHSLMNALFSSETKRPGEQGAAGYFPKILLLKSAKMVLCPFQRSHREICTRNRPVSETKFWMISGGPFLSRPLCFIAALFLAVWAHRDRDLKSLRKRTRCGTCLQNQFLGKMSSCTPFCWASDPAIYSAHRF